jgi:hypothetical protein
LISPFIAAFVYEVIKIYPFFNNPTVIKYQGVAFGLFAILVAVAPGLELPRIPTSKRSSERNRSHSPVSQRLEGGATGPIQPSTQLLAQTVVYSDRTAGQGPPRPAGSRSNGSPSNGSGSNGNQVGRTRSGAGRRS